MEATILTQADRRRIYVEQYRQALRSFKPNCPGDRYSGQQRAAAKGIARKRALEIIDRMESAHHDCASGCGAQIEPEDYAEGVRHCCECDPDGVKDADTIGMVPPKF